MTALLQEIKECQMCKKTNSKKKKYQEEIQDHNSTKGEGGILGLKEESRANRPSQDDRSSPFPTIFEIHLIVMNNLKMISSISAVFRFMIYLVIKMYKRSIHVR